jgi:hypothetical protein
MSQKNAKRIRRELSEEVEMRISDCYKRELAQESELIMTDEVMLSLINGGFVMICNEEELNKIVKGDY